MNISDSFFTRCCRKFLPFREKEGRKEVQTTNGREVHVIFLTNQHDKKEHFCHQAAMIQQHFDHQRGDILLVEAAEGTTHYASRKQRFQQACPTVENIQGWADLEAYQNSLRLKKIFQATIELKNREANGRTKEWALSTLSSEFPSVETEEELLLAAENWLESSQAKNLVFNCLNSYQNALIDKISSCPQDNICVFVDVGFLHVNEEMAINMGFRDFVPQINKLKTSLTGKRVSIFNPASI